MEPDWLAIARPHLTDKLLQVMAETDFELRVVRDIAALERLRDGDPDAPLPLDALRAVRDSEPDDPARSLPQGDGAPGHWMRLFACALLVRAGDAAAQGPLSASAAALGLSGAAVRGAATR